MNDPPVKEIRLPYPNPQFRARLAGTQIRPAHPGSALKIEERIYEVVQALGEAHDWHYILERWNETHTIRVLIEWSPEIEKDFILWAERAEQNEKLRKAAWFTQVLLGFLPACHQKRLRDSIGFEPHKATFWSALLEYLLSSCYMVLFTIVTYAHALGGLFGAHGYLVRLPLWLAVLASITSLDGLLRLVHNISTGEPIGSILLFFLDTRFSKKGGTRETLDADSRMNASHAGQGGNSASHAPGQTSGK
jgi:hypothetical protein